MVPNRIPDAVNILTIGFTEPVIFVTFFGSRTIAIGPPYGAAHTIMFSSSVSTGHSIEYSSYFLEKSDKFLFIKNCVTHAQKPSDFYTKNANI